MTSIEWDNRIRTNIKAAVKDECPTVTDEEKNTYPTYPVLFIQLGNSPEIAKTLIPEDNGSLVSYKLQIYTNGPNKRSKAKKVMELADEEMRRMGFYCNKFTQVNLFSGIFSYMAYYDRPIMQGEEISKRPTP